MHFEAITVTMRKIKHTRDGKKMLIGNYRHQKNDYAICCKMT